MTIDYRGIAPPGDADRTWKKLTLAATTSGESLGKMNFLNRGSTISMGSMFGGMAIGGPELNITVGTCTGFPRIKLVGATEEPKCVEPITIPLRSLTSRFCEAGSGTCFLTSVVELFGEGVGGGATVGLVAVRAVEVVGAVGVVKLGDEGAGGVVELVAAGFVELGEVEDTGSGVVGVSGVGVVLRASTVAAVSIEIGFSEVVTSITVFSVVSDGSVGCVVLL